MIVVTGGDGFIGANLIERLKKDTEEEVPTTTEIATTEIATTTPAINYCSDLFQNCENCTKT